MSEDMHDSANAVSRTAETLAPSAVSAPPLEDRIAKLEAQRHKYRRAMFWLYDELVRHDPRRADEIMASADAPADTKENGE